MQFLCLLDLCARYNSARFFKCPSISQRLIVSINTNRSQQNITSVQAPVRGKNTQLADKSDSHILAYNVASQIWQLQQYGLARMETQWKGTNYCLSFHRRREKVKRCLLFGCDFLSPRTARVSGIERYPSICISCCSDDLALGLDGLLFFFTLLSYSCILKIFIYYSYHTTQYSFHHAYYSQSKYNTSCTKQFLVIQIAPKTVQIYNNYERRLYCSITDNCIVLKR